jgi:hypothetical protein
MNETAAMLILFGLGVIAVAGIGFLAWLHYRFEERKVFRRSDSMRRIAEQPGEAASQTLAFLRAEERIRHVRQREGLRLGGLLTTVSGVGMVIGLLPAAVTRPYAGMGLIPAAIGAGLLFYATKWMPEPDAWVQGEEDSK